MEEEDVDTGGVTVNNVLGHLQQGDLPFGGVGPSGMGQYDGHDGFKNFSNQKAVYKDISDPQSLPVEEVLIPVLFFDEVIIIFGNSSQ